MILTLSDSALGERVTSVTVETQAHCCVTNYVTLCANSTGIKARIFTHVVHTRLVSRTLGIANALWSTVWWRAYVIWQTNTCRISIYDLIFRVCTADARRTWFFHPIHRRW